MENLKLRERVLVSLSIIVVIETLVIIYFILKYVIKP